MPRGGWLSYLRPQAGAEIPAGLRLIVGAVSGAALSLSYHGLYLSIYSWVCVAILLFSLFGAQPRVSFGCGFLHALLFVLTSVPWIATVLTAHGGLSVAGGWGVLLLIAMAWGILIGSFAWVPCGRESGFGSTRNHHGNLRTLLSCSRFQRTARLDQRIEHPDDSRPDHLGSRCNGNTLDRSVGWSAPGATSAGSSFRARRAAQFPGDGFVPRRLVSGARRGPR